MIQLIQNTEAEAVSTEALSSSVTGNSVTAMVVGPGEATVTAVTAEGVQYSQTFSVNDGSNNGAVKTETIELEVDESKNVTQDGVNNESNVKVDRYDSTIAEVTVAGTDEIPGKDNYSKTTVTRAALAGNNTNWALTDYFYLKNNIYYPVYAYKSSYDQKYYYGYKADSSVTQIGRGNTDGSKTVTVYTKSITDPTPASTTITFEGLMPGTTYYTVGDTEYTIIVSPKEVTEKKETN